MPAPLFENGNESLEKRNFKLPKIELKKFNGDIKDYLSFWSQIQKIHEDKSVSDSDKFQYLIQTVIPNSKDTKVVESCLATAANYQQAINRIQEIFGIEDLLVQVYLWNLVSKVIKNTIASRVK